MKHHRVKPLGNGAYYVEDSCGQIDPTELLAKQIAQARLDAKLDKAIKLLSGRRNMPLAGPDTAMGPSAGQMAAQWRKEYDARIARTCAEQKAAYDARNPHKKEWQA